jgi:HSP20 family molecular chaperone IbpA
MLKYYMTRLPQVPIVVPRHNSVRFRRLHSWAEIAPPLRVPAITLSHTADTVVLTATLPGFTPENLAIDVSRDVVLLQGQGGFQRMIQLPIGVDHSRATAAFNGEMLTLTLPKLPTGRSTRVTVAIGSDQPAVVPTTHDPVMELSPEMPATAETADPTAGDPWQ